MHCSRAVTARKSTIERDERGKVVVFLMKRIAFLPFSLPSRSLFLKLPTVEKVAARYQCSS